MKNLHLENRSVAGTNAVKAIRKSKLNRGLPFMINVIKYGKNVCYLEYPDGKINLVELSYSGTNFQTIRVLPAAEADDLRTRFALH